ncbi:reverse transcriptase [Tanacetum coccineum]
MHKGSIVKPVIPLSSKPLVSLNTVNTLTIENSQNNLFMDWDPLMFNLNMRVDTPHGFSVKLNCDAAFENSSAAFGIVARDCAGLLRYVIGNRCRAVSLLHAEIIAVHFACSLVFNHGCFNAIVESDSQIAISLSSLDTSPPWSLAALVEDIRIWAENMQIRFSWVNRESNQVAHWVAHHAFSSTLGFSWDVSFSDELTSLSRSDLYGS